MKIETKFNIGDNVYYLELGSEFVRESDISNIAIYKGFKKPYDVCYTISQYDGEKNVDKIVSEGDCFGSEEEAIATLIKYHKVQVKKHEDHLDRLAKWKKEAEEKR